MRLLRGVVAAACAFGVLSVRVNADPAERRSTIADQQSINLTIYNGGTSALVHDRRRIMLDAGANDIAWREVSGQLDATSAILDDVASPGSTVVREQNFSFDLLRPKAVLDAYVGKRVVVVHDKPVDGRSRSESATLLADNDGVVLAYADRIETGLYDSRLVFPSIPANLRDRPTLALRLDAATAGVHDLDLRYLTRGLGWSADYVGTVSPDETRMNVSGLVTLTNTSGTTFPNARLQLVAGRVNEAVLPGTDFQPTETYDTYTTDAPAPPRFVQQNLFEYHLYTLDRPTTVANGQTKQVAFLAAKSVPIRKTLEVRGNDAVYRNSFIDLPATLPIGVFLSFTNKDGDLGVPLPGGVFRLYTTDANGLSQYLGGETIQHTPRDQDVRLSLGNAYDMTETKTQTAFATLGPCTFASSYDVAIENAENDAHDVQVIEPLPGTWAITAESLPHVKSSASTATWTVHVAPQTTTTLTYSARVAVCP